MALINYERELALKWSNECIIVSEISRKIAGSSDPNLNLLVQGRAATQTAGVRFQINNAKLYVPVVTLSMNDNIKFLEKINQ